ncbi:MAG: FAD:protein FMN transferase [Verrucomicrobia bacterium]|nr:FAD:protein FMN transferase [Verrucomicrobiota bacterium]
MNTVATARHAMATRFEIVLHGDHEPRLRAAAEEALEEIQRLDAQLSLYSPTSDISRLNASAAAGPVKVAPELFRLLRRAKTFHRETGGAFDITVGPLMRCWGFMRDTGRLPSDEELTEARQKAGMELIELDEKNFTVRFRRAGVMLDLGAIGKGYALERAADLLRETGITSAILHGGTSTVCAIGTPPDANAWMIGIEDPQNTGGAVGEAKRPLLAAIPLKDESLSVSAVWGKSFEIAGKTYGHVIDPRTGRPANNAVLAAVALPSATESDAFSTALLTLGREGLDSICELRPQARALVVAPTGDGGFTASARGIVLRADLQNSRTAPHGRSG